MSDCIFCKISSGVVPTDFIYEDDTVVCFKDLYPKASTHLLIVPKKHIDSIMHLEERDENIAGHMIKVAKDVAKKKELKGYKLQINVGKDGGQEIFHIHLHLMSKFS